MTDERKSEIISDLQAIYDNFTPDYDRGFDFPSMFWLICTYNETGKNSELIGGDWVIENCPSPLKDLP